MIDPRLPLIDLHRHLDGNVRLETILELGRRHNLPLPAWDIEGLRPHVQVTAPQPGLMAFFEKFEWMRGVLVDYDACWRIAYENVEDLQREGIDYGELRFSPWFMAEPHQLDPAGVVEAVVDGVETACRNLEMRVGLIGIISRHYGVDIAWKELGALLTQRDHLKALDLAGDEANYPGELFIAHVQKARDAGWRITVHAGEDGGPQSMSHWPRRASCPGRGSARFHAAAAYRHRNQPDQQCADQRGERICHASTEALSRNGLIGYHQHRRSWHQWYHAGS